MQSNNQAEMKMVTKKQAEVHAELKAMGLEPGNESLNDVERAWLRIQERNGSFSPRFSNMSRGGQLKSKPTQAWLTSVSDTYVA